MVVAYHLIWTAYGWWLPNDPRGSNSQVIRIERIADLGDLHPGRKAVQPPSAELRAFYERAGQILQHPLLSFTAAEVAVLAASFARGIRDNAYTCYACAIMPDHVHALIRKQRDKAETMIGNLQEISRAALVEAGQRPGEHPVWGGPGWKVFLNTRADIERVINYIRDNPIKAGLPRQNWEFVKEYDGWLPRGA